MADEEDNLDSLKEELHVGTGADHSPVKHKAKIKLPKGKDLSRCPLSSNFILFITRIET
jgi:hypothetical protein